MNYRKRILNALALLSICLALPAAKGSAQVASKETQAEARKLPVEANAAAKREVQIALDNAVRLVAGGETTNAILEYLHAFEAAPDNEIALQGYIRQVSQLGATSNAISQHSKRLAKSPNDLAARLLLAELLRSEFRFNDALDHYWLARRRDPANPVALRGIAESQLGSGFTRNAGETFTQLAPRDGRVREAANGARVMLAEERPEAALAMLLARSTEVNQNPSALLVLADVYRALGQKGKELAALRTSFALQKRASLETIEKLARAEFEGGDNDAARKACEQALKLDPRNVTCAFGLTLLGTTAPQANPEPKGADSKNSDAQELPQKEQARLAARERDMGEAAIYWNQSARALPFLRQSLALWADSPRILLSLGATLLRTGETEVAASTFARITDNRNLTALLLLAKSKTANRKPEQALPIYRYVLDLDEGNISALLGEVDALQSLGDIQRVALSLTRLAQQAPESNRINSRLRESLTALGRYYKMTELLSSSADIKRSSGALVGQPIVARTQTVEPVLEVGDKLKLRVVGKPTLDADVQVDERGFIRIPFIAERIGARCSTLGELQNEIARLSRSRPSGAGLELSLTEYSRLPLIIAGAVYLPGKFNIRAPLNLRESLMLASGATPSAGRSVHVLRGAAMCDDQLQNLSTGKFETYERSAIEANQVSLSQPLRAGDLVVVPEGDQVYITGAVVRPSAVGTRGGLTLLKAVESLGGTKPEARRNDVRLLRLTPDGAGYQKFSVNLDDIAERRIGDIVMLAGDIVEVHSASGKFGQRPYYSFWQQSLRGTRTIVPPVSAAKHP